MNTADFGDNRWKILCGCYEGAEKIAVDLIYAAVSKYTEYVLVCEEATKIGLDELKDINPIFIGTVKSNEYIKRLAEDGTIVLPSNEEGYLIEVTESAFNPEKQMIVISGTDANGVMYGAIDFESRYLAENALFTHELEQDFKKYFRITMPEYHRVSAPDIKNRAIWTWGHVIYDYRGFIDNMMKLKLNMIVIWNDHVPLNARDVVEYAHARGIRVIFGYSWGWGVDVDISSRSSIEKWSEMALESYEKNYRDLGGDGIYFQSFTETQDEQKDGVIIAGAVRDWVNIIGGKILSVYPDLEIQFGLHATSVRNKLEFIKEVDERISIIWEDCGAFPYHYVPKMLDGFQETKDFSSRIATLRGNTDRFGVVLKGLICLDWLNFEHQKGRFVMGVSDETKIKSRTGEKTRYWRYVQAYWLQNSKYVMEILRLFKDERGKDITVQALVEDGMLESRLWFPVALYAEMLWNCSADPAELMCSVALNPDVTFA